jgi:hypothetical protein
LHDFVSVREQLRKHDIGLGTYLVLKSNLKLHINGEILLDYIRTVFIHNLAEFCAVDEFTEEMAMLLMDNWLSYITRDVIAPLTKT